MQAPESGGATDTGAAGIWIMRALVLTTGISERAGSEFSDIDINK